MRSGRTLFLSACLIGILSLVIQDISGVNGDQAAPLCFAKGENTISCIFGVAGEWTPPVNVTDVLVSLWGGGGGGGGASLVHRLHAAGGGSGSAVIGVPIAFVWEGTSAQHKLAITRMGKGGSGGRGSADSHGSSGKNGGSTSIAFGDTVLTAYGGGGGRGSADRLGGGGGGSGGDAALDVGGRANPQEDDSPTGPSGTIGDGVPGEAFGNVQAGASGGGGNRSRGGDWPDRFNGGTPENGEGGGAAGYNGNGGGRWSSTLTPNSGAGGAGGSYSLSPSPAVAHNGGSGSDGGVLVEYTLVDAANVTQPYGHFVPAAPSPTPVPGSSAASNRASFVAVLVSLATRLLA